MKPAQRLTAQRKLELYFATRALVAPAGEILRQYGLHLADLRQIEQTIESAAQAALKAKSHHGRLPTDVTPKRLPRLEQELTEMTRARAELSVAFNVLEKKSARTTGPHPPAPSPVERHDRARGDFLAWDGRLASGRVWGLTGAGMAPTYSTIA